MTSRAALVLLFACLALPSSALSQVTTRNIELKSHWDEFSGDYSACWSYIHQDGREYAILGCQTGTAIYNVTDPVNSYRVGFIAGASSIWREMKSYRNYIYVVTEAEGFGPTRGMQIISMVDPEAPALVANYAIDFVTAHTVAVDTTRALLICNGTRMPGTSPSSSGMHILSLANPTAPVRIGRWPAAAPFGGSNYIHDSVPVGNRLFASSISAGFQRVFDFTDPTNPTQLASWTYPGAFTHNAWPDASGQWLYVTDEVNGQRLKVFDISNLASPVMKYGFTSNPQAIVHNAHVLGNELYLSNYTEGIRILDISDPAHPAEFAWADSWQGVSGSFHSVWEVCPYFPSGTVIASDIETGLYVYRAQRNYGVLRVKVELSGTGPMDACANDGGSCCCAPGPCDCGGGHDVDASPANGVTVTLSPGGDSLTTYADGIVQFGPNPGTYTITARKFGFATATASRSVTVGSRDTVVLSMGSIPTTEFSGLVRAAGSQAPLEEAELTLLDSPLHDHTDPAGQFLLSQVPSGTYTVEVRRPGSIAHSEVLAIGPAVTNANYDLDPTITWDPLETGSGWTVGGAGDDATAGVWTRVDPLGTGTPNPNRVTTLGGSALRIDKPGAGLHHEGHESDGVAPGTVQPENDRTPPPGTHCFVTGQGVFPDSLGEGDVDGGRTSLISPAFDLSTRINAMVGWWHWFYGADNGAEDMLITSISNDDGATWVPVDTTRGFHNHWMERVVRVGDYVAPSAQVRLRFEAADFGDASIVEAAIDDLASWDGPQIVAVPAATATTRLAFRAPWPNPARGRVQLSLDVPYAGPLTVDVLDVQGRRIRTLHDGLAAAGPLELEWSGADERGQAAPIGIYYARARGATGEALTRFVQLR